MEVQYYDWYSHRVGMNMGVLRIGSWGPAMIYFPTCGGKHGEIDYYRLQEDAAPWIENGNMQFFAIDSINQESWYNRDIHPADRINWATGYEGYIVHELVPFVRNMTHNPFVGCMGASFGGYNVTNLFLKHPDCFQLAVSMSGLFDIRQYLEGYYDTNVYLNNPVDYIPGLADPWFYHMYNNESLLWMFCGENDICKGDNDHFHHLLSAKGIRHWYDVWPAPCDHHEYWWKKQLPVVLDKFYNW